MQEQSSLLVANAAKFQKWFNVTVKESTEVVAIDRAAKKITARDVNNGQESVHPYDYLVLSPGGHAIRPPLPGADLPGIFVVKTIPDANAIKAWITEKGAKSAVVVGGGFIGLEVLENLVHRGLKCSLVEMLPQVMPPYDPEVVEPVHDRLRAAGVELHLGDGVSGFEAGPAGSAALLAVKTQSGKTHAADLVVLAIGVRPETTLARQAGLELGSRGGIKVDERMRTSDSAIFAVGDVAEVKDFVTGEQTLIPLAGPANRQGRIVADVISGNEPSRFRGSQGTSVVGLFGLTLAATGASEKTLRRLGRTFRKVYLHINNHAGYYPGAKQIDIKLLFDPTDGRVLGMQAVGEEGVEKRVDVVAMAIQKGGTVFDLEEAELCYAPQYGSAKDPVNMVGMVAANVLRNQHPLTSWDELDLQALTADPGCVLVDVREPPELDKVGKVESAVNMPLSSLRQQLAKLQDKDKKYYVYCQVGLRGYIATRQFLQAGFDAVNVSGGYKSFQQQLQEQQRPAKL
ncbi:hypothetical protein VOLCADRAFT_86222 [Volvox carteri f. nagariensis]|uniref:Rhodanese domain-containing protein n=1 Tax=Volvox carteri f. nagariensis TaxID=3068 RepID=D8TI78_VOLCA|nr:uncharacterized protein VOLCADRAFT_86222 [Volvox carteri f. nagariensis]EFJ52848.1 hypothetical protein VOLCADRAFT_86222 [Volvox carteri f. nagariensis]|eukprot:XP_002945853.1 hypothetical protein VOLCADRAFT_86222 [Volvox carteri f. nagariensis]